MAHGDGSSRKAVQNPYLIRGEINSLDTQGVDHTIEMEMENEKEALPYPWPLRVEKQTHRVVEKGTMGMTPLSKILSNERQGPINACELGLGPIRGLVLSEYGTRPIDDTWLHKGRIKVGSPVKARSNPRKKNNFVGKDATNGLAVPSLPRC